MHRLILLLCLVSSLAWADRIEIIQLQHRPAEELIPLIKPMLGPGDAISGQGDQLILRASPQTLGQVRQMLATLDRAPRNLLISVRASEQDLRAREGGQTEIRVGSEGIAIQGGAGSARLGTGAEAMQQIRVQEGMPAMLHIGEKDQRIEPVLIPYPGGLAALPLANTRETGRWLRVVPRLQGEQVMLEIEPQAALPDPRHPDTLEVQRLATRVVVPLGQWVPLGGLESLEQGKASGWNVATHSQSSQVWVKVELLDSKP